ncbi:MAG: undecaprenyl diphosphate synthase family protein [Methanomicrobiales archaeon]|nr:undecaprenyl diphosphate synthase family protein [Methanomicrobiales archaeon]
MIYWLYERRIERQLSLLPAHICVMITEQDMHDAPDKILACTRWCIDISEGVAARASGYAAREIDSENEKSVRDGSTLNGLTFHISTKKNSPIEKYLPVIRKIGEIAHLVIHYREQTEDSGTGLPVTVAIGKSGREEITECIKSMARSHTRPDQVDEKLLESCLTFKYTPDFVIKTGGDHLTDFLIWQSVYSELFFSDTNWKYIRKVDVLRALRDYQSRVRRFGR